MYWSSFLSYSYGLPTNNEQSRLSYSWLTNELCQSMAPIPGPLFLPLVQQRIMNKVYFHIPGSTMNKVKFDFPIPGSTMKRVKVDFPTPGPPMNYVKVCFPIPGPLTNIFPRLSCNVFISL